MKKFPSLGTDATVPAILQMSPDAGVALMHLHEAIMRAPGPLTPGERELIAAYVSGLNKCSYCHGVHTQTAIAYGFSADAIAALFDGIDSAPVADKLKPLLQYAAGLTDAPSEVTAADAQACYDAGWDEQALHDTIMVVACFNFMNRLLEGHGVEGNDAMYRARGPMLKQHGYASLVPLLQRRSAPEAG